MDPNEIRTLLGMSPEASDEDVRKNLSLASQILVAFDRKRNTLGLHAEGGADAVLTRLNTPESELVTELRDTVVTMSEEVRGLKEDIKRADAMRDIEKYGSERPISEPMVETLLNLHMQNPSAAIQIMKALPVISRKRNWPDAKQAASDAASPLDAEIKRNMS